MVMKTRGDQSVSVFSGSMRTFADSMAMNLSQMPAETLRQLATGLFEITY